MSAFIVHYRFHRLIEGVTSLHHEVLFPQAMLNLIKTSMWSSVGWVLQFSPSSAVLGVEAWTQRKLEISRPKVGEVVFEEFLHLLRTHNYRWRSLTKTYTAGLYNKRQFPTFTSEFKKWRGIFLYRLGVLAYDPKCKSVDTAFQMVFGSNFLAIDSFLSKFWFWEISEMFFKSFLNFKIYVFTSLVSLDAFNIQRSVLNDADSIADRGSNSLTWSKSTIRYLLASFLSGLVRSYDWRWCWN